MKKTIKDCEERYNIGNNTLCTIKYNQEGTDLYCNENCPMKEGKE